MDVQINISSSLSLLVLDRIAHYKTLYNASIYRLDTNIVIRIDVFVNTDALCNEKSSIQFEISM